MSQTSNQYPTPDLAPPTIAGRWCLTAGNRAQCTVRNFGFKKVLATMPITEAVVQADADGVLASVRAVLNLSEIDTGNVRRDKDLAKPKLLDVKRFPLMTFSAAGGDQPSAANPRSGTVHGTLEAHGSAVPVVVHYAIVDAQQAESARRQLTVRLTTSFDRADLDINVPALMISRRVDVDFTAEFEPAR